MCSIGEDDFGDEGGLHGMVPDSAAAETVISESQGVCKKCGVVGVMYKLTFREAECRECFLTYARHKFRATLGSSKILPKDAKVLLVFDGSAEAMVLLDMLYHAQTQNTFKRLHCTAQILYIDDTILEEQTSSAAFREKHILAMKEFLAAYEHFEGFVVPVSTCAKQPLQPFNIKDIQQYLIRSQATELEFAAKLNAMHSLTTRQDFLKNHRSHLIAAAAKHFKCGFAFLPDISTMLAAQLLGAIVLGRGASAAYDVALVDDRLADNVKLVRPLKNLTEAEVQLYLSAREMREPLQKHHYGTSQKAETSLQNLTSAFVEDLQKSFSATVSTVFRTGDKIAPNNHVEEQLATLTLNGDKEIASVEKQTQTKCAFCNSSLDFAGSSTLLAIEFSRIISETGNKLNECTDIELRAQKCVNGTNSKTKQQLCHACRNIQNECTFSLIDS